ncbi:hypothetical protein ASPZODRAFT_59723 [Penicilliopsis zonata CBS 506.65]|uniref:Inositol polyphosphate-related phosphatase domain-containing protein n=1 Tax=Penicilliopsis zonata CBS 506.65 TaxID=1073090 RepID=A0A1L9SPL9_9EURO|nr:hypothetical protein ASPZODRAFT_59723 [Penicilliopsis zonata CBS 506.65]OJJ49043.1 hypothetical protein ASPZODRAFT_59723 [Penicilliopsis zonata CBS 506.65]
MESDGKGMGKDSTDNAPIRPVSSLLSHFENLAAHRRSPSAITTTSLLKTPDPADDGRFSSRISLDLPRPHLPWTSDPDLHNGQTLHTPQPAVSPGSSGRKGRPMSMNFHSSPQLAPVLTVDSPRSPPRGFGSNGGDNNNNINDNNGFAERTQNGRSRASPSPPAPPARESTESQASLSRPTTPQYRTSVITEQKTGRLSPGAPVASARRESPSAGKTKSVSLPPPVNRADKPKIPTKPVGLSHLDTNHASLLPKPENGLPPDERAVSPFSTPPGSPEKLPLKPTHTGRSSIVIPARSPSRPLMEDPQPRQSLDERRRPPGPPPPAAIRDAREMGFARRRPAQEPNRDTKPLSVQIPPTLPFRLEPQSAAAAVATTAPPLSANRLRSGDSLYEPPNLPPRQPSQRSRRPPTLSPRIAPADNTSVNQLPVFRTETSNPQRHELQTPVQIQRQPSFSRDTKPGARVSSTHLEAPPLRDAEEEGLLVVPDEPLVSRTDYPDSSQVNRRPPLLKSGPYEIHTRYDTRLFDVCGRYVCTTGYITRVWDLTTGEQVLSLSHGETVKCLSIAFKPGKDLESEGQRLWLGSSSGELHEVDIATQSIVGSRSYPSRREIIKILRHQKEMWTLDDEGRLLVWPPDETGTPNLQYSYHNPYDRVARGHTFSMVVGDKLWLAAGKEVHIYRPNARDDASFKVLKRPLGSLHSGEVTSGTYVSKDGGRVYLGHNDGKVSVYSATEYTCLASVNVSVYKINCLGMVGDYLWAAYKTGMIYVYNITTNPWTVKKDWRAHDSPVCGFLLDTSSVWTMNRLQVASLGTDNCIRLWDGMLEDDWLDDRMLSKDVEFCDFREIRATVLTWNAGASTPSNVRSSNFIQDAIHPENPPEILVFGFQELVDLENKKITAKSLLLGSKKRENGEKEHMSRQYRVWMEHLTGVINECMPLEESYVLLHTANLIGLFTCIFIKHKERDRVRNISAAEVKRGMGGLHGNKGALIFRFVLDDTSLCFVNCHLAAGQTQTANRNNDIAAILEAESLPSESNLLTRAKHFVSGGDGAMIMDHEVCILNGDLNYRIDAIPRNVIIEDIRKNNFSKLLDRDQLLASRRKNPGFRLRSFMEAPITFAPTYKYDVGTDDYDSSDKKRSPAWCDRVLYRGLGRIKQLEYRRHEARASDHRPVSAYFKMRIKTVVPDARAATWEKCQQEFQTEKRRLASDASIEYLINVLGTDPKSARALIMG